MKRKYSSKEIQTSIPRYVSNERKEYLEEQKALEDIREKEQKLRELNELINKYEVKK